MSLLPPIIPEPPIILEPPIVSKSPPTWLLNQLSEEAKAAFYYDRYPPSSTAGLPLFPPPPTPKPTTKLYGPPKPLYGPPKPKSTAPTPTPTAPTPTPTASKNPPVTSVEYPMMMNVPTSMKPQGEYTGGKSATDIAWRNYWNAQAEGKKTYQSGVAPSRLPPPPAQYSDLNVAQRQMFRKKRSEGASWEQALNAARSNK